jgi:hypothetical protein
MGRKGASPSWYIYKNSTLMKEAVRSSKIITYYHTRWHNMPKDHHHTVHHCAVFKYLSASEGNRCLCIDIHDVISKFQPRSISGTTGRPFENLPCSALWEPLQKTTSHHPYKQQHTHLNFTHCGSWHALHHPKTSFCISLTCEVTWSSWTAVNRFKCYVCYFSVCNRQKIWYKKIFKNKIPY